MTPKSMYSGTSMAGLELEIRALSSIYASSIKFDVYKTHSTNFTSLNQAAHFSTLIAHVEPITMSTS